MICKVCNVNNSEDSKFCVECGASFGVNNGKYKRGEIKRVVSAEEMKNYLWSFDFSKVKDKEGLDRMICTEMQKWRQNPNYIPIISAPTKTGGFIQAPKNVDMKEFKREWEKLEYDMKLEPLQRQQDYSVEDRLLRGHEQEYDPKKIKKMEENLSKIYPGILCGVCGAYDCQEIHIPPIQQQYQEAFENIQRIRRKRYERMTFTMDDLMRRDYSYLFHDDVFGKPPKSKIIERDVRKGINPRMPFKSIRIRK